MVESGGSKPRLSVRRKGAQTLSSPSASARTPGQVTELLVAWRRGTVPPSTSSFPLVEAELRQLAHRYLRRERPGHVLQATALVNEAFIRLLNWRDVNWQNRAHFVAMAARLMRNVLVDLARRRAKDPTGHTIRLADSRQPNGVASERFETSWRSTMPCGRSPTSTRGRPRIELRFFGGLSLPEIAEVWVWRRSPSAANGPWRGPGFIERSETETGRRPKPRPRADAMNDPRWTTVDGLFEAALERNPDERPAFLREACAGNETLRQEVESLLAHASGAQDFLERPAVALVGPTPTEERQSLVGRQFGSYASSFARHRRHGRGVSRARYDARAGRGDQDAAARVRAPIPSASPASIARRGCWRR